MLQSVLEQKVALAAYATERSNITVLTPYQLDLAQKVVEALQPQFLVIQSQLLLLYHL